MKKICCAYKFICGSLSLMKKVGELDSKIASELNINTHSFEVFQSKGLFSHIQKRHPSCIGYVHLIPLIISDPDYIGINPNENSTSLELIKTFNKNIQIGIKIDNKKQYLYVATLHEITYQKIQHRLKNGRLKQFNK